VIVAHLSDLHLKDLQDTVEFGAQLDRISARQIDHLVITGDLLDRWSPSLLEAALDTLHARGLLDGKRLTLIHGNHDLASSGGHPRARADLWRLVSRFWDPPPLIALRKRRFYHQIAARTREFGASPPFSKTTQSGLRIAALDSVPASWTPVAPRRGYLLLRHGVGAISQRQNAWLAQQRGTGPLVVLVHHYPLPVGAFHWSEGRGVNVQGVRTWNRWLSSYKVVVPMEIDPRDREAFWTAAHAAGATAVLCGHVHRARLDYHGAIAVGLNGQSGAAWAGRTIAYYTIAAHNVTAEYESLHAAVSRPAI
jgi:3',5'-cyclic AMP phosphodiesterase CpdA